MQKYATQYREEGRASIEEAERIRGVLLSGAHWSERER
jgi:hypothetical protein